MAEMTPAERAPGLDEAKVGKTLAWAIPAATLATAAVVAVVFSFAIAILVCIGGTLIGVIAILWGSLRVLSGDAPLPPELEELDRSAHSVDAFAARKKMLVRALKDLENERDLGKLDETDFEQIAATYRAELKEVLRRIDATLEPHRAAAEEIARAYLEEKDVAETPEKAADRRICPKCEASNEPDAKFCKECATALAPSPKDEDADT